jgi:DNA-binding response OmpR family regulator
VSGARINLESATVMLVEDNPQGMDILLQIMRAFGVARIHTAQSAEEAQKMLGGLTIDLFFVAADLPSVDGFDFVSWLRRTRQEPNCHAPVLMVAGHTQLSKVEKARDCGANFIVAKPLTPAVLLNRVLWVAREKRCFIETDRYLGPDRRFKFMGPPAGTQGRRRDDLTGEIGAAIEPNMSQAQIDSLLQPQKARL